MQKLSLFLDKKQKMINSTLMSILVCTCLSNAYLESMQSLSWSVSQQCLPRLYVESILVCTCLSIAYLDSRVYLGVYLCFAYLDSSVNLGGYLCFAYLDSSVYFALYLFIAYLDSRVNLALYLCSAEEGGSSRWIVSKDYQVLYGTGKPSKYC